MVTDPVAHVTGVSVLCDQERILVLFVFGRGQCCLMLDLVVDVDVDVFWRRSFGFDAPQDSVCPGWFSFLPAECNNISFVSSTVTKCYWKRWDTDRRWTHGGVDLTACRGGCQKWKIPFKMVSQQVS